MSTQDWSELPEEALRNIAARISSIKGFARFGGVCKSWRSVVLHKLRFSSMLKPLPWLMLTGGGDNKDTRYFLSPLENKVRSLSLPIARGCRCWDSSSGWLVTLGVDEHFHLLNAFSHSRIPLPSLSTFPDHNLVKNKPGYSSADYIFKAVLLILPNSTSDTPHFIVFAIYGDYRRLAFARPGDKAWTRVKFPCLSFQSDVILVHGDIYSIDSDGRTWRCHITGDDPYAKKFMDPPHGEDSFHVFSLVELRKELHMTVRTLDFGQYDKRRGGLDNHFETAFIRVYTLSVGGVVWNRVLNLGRCTIFMGGNTSLSVEAYDYPRCRPGCIYFSDKRPPGRISGHDTGIFNLETEELEPLYPRFELGSCV